MNELLNSEIGELPEYGPTEAASIAALRKRKPTKRAARPTHYKVICISMYTRDIDGLSEKVAELKRRGWTKANKSELIRIALARLDLDQVVASRR